jgi:hypothetical protein
MFYVINFVFMLDICFKIRFYVLSLFRLKLYALNFRFYSSYIRFVGFYLYVCAYVNFTYAFYV